MIKRLTTTYVSIAKKKCLLIPDESTISISTFSWKKISYYCVFRCNAKTEKNMKKIKAKILY